MLQPPSRRRIGQGPDDLAINLDQKWQALGLFPESVEIRIRPCPPIQLEQVVREKPLKLVAIVEPCVTPRPRQGARPYTDRSAGPSGWIQRHWRTRKLALMSGVPPGSDDSHTRV